MPEITSQAWLIATLTEAGSRLNTAIGAGATDPQVCWTDSDQNTVTAKAHGQGITLEVKRGDDQSLIGPLKIPFGWTQEG